MEESSLIMFPQRDVAVRYFANVFLFHRHVLYFFLHQDFEDAIQPSDGHAGDIDPLWSRKECVEHAILLIYTCASSSPFARNWCHHQPLFAAYLVVLQTKDLPAFSPIFTRVGELSIVLLQRVERKFQNSAGGSPLNTRSLEIMKLLRQRFAHSPPLHGVLAPA